MPQDGAKKIAPGDENGWQTVSASALPFREGEPAPLAMDRTAIEKVKNDYAEATRRAVEAGYDVVEIHAAHGYLFHQFYSPLANQRSDDYGGSLDNRIRFLLEVTQVVRKEWPDEKPLFVRISATDWTEGGWTVEDSVVLAQRLKGLGVDLIDTSTGGNVPRAVIPSAPGYQAPFAERIKKEAKIMTGAVGQITTAKQSEEILRAGKADLILYARQALRQPYLPLQAAAQLGVDVEWPIQYLRAKT